MSPCLTLSVHTDCVTMFNIGRCVENVSAFDINVPSATIVHDTLVQFTLSLSLTLSLSPFPYNRWSCSLEIYQVWLKNRGRGAWPPILGARRVTVSFGPLPHDCCWQVWHLQLSIVYDTPGYLTNDLLMQVYGSRKFQDQQDGWPYMSTPSDAHLYNLLEKSIKSIRNP